MLLCHAAFASAQAYHFVEVGPPVVCLTRCHTYAEDCPPAGVRSDGGWPLWWYQSGIGTPPLLGRYPESVTSFKKTPRWRESAGCGRGGAGVRCRSAVRYTRSPMRLSDEAARDRVAPLSQLLTTGIVKVSRLAEGGRLR